jgi:hypothetical protein
MLKDKSSSSEDLSIEELQMRLRELRPEGKIARENGEASQLRTAIESKRKGGPAEMHPSNGKPPNKMLKNQEQVGDGIHKAARAVVFAPVGRQLHFKVVGTSQLIMEAWPPKVLKQLEDEQCGIIPKPKKSQRPVRIIREEWDSLRYKNAKGQDCCLGVHFKKAICSASKFVEGLTPSYLAGIIMVPQERIPIKFKGREPVIRHDIVMVGNFPDKKPMPRWRPGYDDWSCEFDVRFPSNLVTELQVINLLMHAGEFGGIGGWRNQKSGGGHGAFKIDEINGRKIKTEG